MDQRQRPSRTMCRTASSIQGMARNPSLMSTWFTWLSTGPAKANVAAPMMHAAVERASARRKMYIPIAIPEKRTTSVATQAARSGKTMNSPVRGWNAPALKSAINGVPLKMYWFQKGSCPWRIMEPTRTRSG